MVESGSGCSTPLGPIKYQVSADFGVQRVRVPSDTKRLSELSTRTIRQISGS